MGFQFFARKEKQEDGSYAFPEKPIYDAIGREGSTARPNEVISIEKKKGGSVDRVVKRKLHQFESGDTIYELHPHGYEPADVGVSQEAHDALAARVSALEEKFSEMVSKDGAPF